MSTKKCTQCGVALLVDTELDKKYSQGLSSFRGEGAGDRAMDSFAQMEREANAAGVTCAACGKNFCVACMQRSGRPHPTSGGLACLKCGGRMAQFRG